MPLWHPKEPQVAQASKENVPPKDPAVTPDVPADKAVKPPTAPADPLDKFKTVLPNGLTVHNFTS